MKYRKKIVELDAHQWIPEAFGATWPAWFYTAVDDGRLIIEKDQTLTVRALEDGNDWRAKHVASPGDWVVKGIKGELYPVKPDIFDELYEAAL